MESAVYFHSVLTAFRKTLDANGVEWLLKPARREDVHLCGKANLNSLLEGCDVFNPSHLLLPKNYREIFLVNVC